uniref:Putative sterile alpha motif protein n=1 Tax=Lutzomyia longipalpis TaxID=7200 RepID=A0A1B0CEH6_LUTLO
MVTEPVANTTKSKGNVTKTSNSSALLDKCRCDKNGTDAVGITPLYADLFAKHEITGLTLLRMSDHSLLRMGIENNRDREAIWREILKQKLKADIMEIRDLERMAE